MSYLQEMFKTSLYHPAGLTPAYISRSMLIYQLFLEYVLLVTLYSFTEVCKNVDNEAFLA